MKKLYVRPMVEVCGVLPYTLLDGSITQGNASEKLQDNGEYEW